MVIRQILKAQDTSGDGRTWKKKLHDACQKLSWTTEAVYLQAAMDWFTDHNLERQMAKAEEALRLLRAPRRKSRNREPFVVHWVRAFVACIIDQQKLILAA